MKKRLIQYGNVPLDQKLLDVQQVVSRCIVVMKQSQFDRQALRQKIAVDDAPYIEECNHHDFDFDFVLLSSVSVMSGMLGRLVSWLYSKSHVPSAVITLIQFKDALRYPNTTAYGASSNHHSEVLSPFLCRLSTSSKHCPFSCPTDLWSFEQSTDDHHTPLALPAQHWPQSCLLKAPASSFTLLATIFEPLVSLKNNVH